MSAIALPTRAPAGVWLRGFAQLLWLYFSWRAGVLGSALTGLALLALALLTGISNPDLAYTLALPACGLLLGIPLLTAAPMLRTLIGHRTLSLVPQLPLQAGLALLTLTLLTALSLPALAAVLGIPAAGYRFALQVFIAASLYIALMQLLLPWRHAVAGFSLLPAAIIVALSVFGRDLMPVLQQDGMLALLMLLSIAGWARGLYTLAQRTAFKPAQVSGSVDHGHDWLQGLCRLSGIDNHFDVNTGASAAGSLLHGWPASWPVRLLNIANYLVISPLISALLLSLISSSRQQPMNFFSTFMLFSLICGSVSCWMHGELAARARLLWLRVGGDRHQLWRVLERQLWINLLLLLALASVLALLASAAGARESALHYVVILLACAVYDTCLGLCARVCQWPSGVQALVMLLSMVLLGSTVLHSATRGDSTLLLLAEACMLLSAIRLRALARTRFVTIDWLQVQHRVTPRSKATP